MAKLVEAMDLKNLSLYGEIHRVETVNSGKPKYIIVMAIPS